MRTNGPDYESAIDRSDAQTLFIRAANGQVYKVPRHEVYDIDHPGNVTMVVGISMLGFGAAFLASSFGDDGPNDDDLRAVGLIYGVPGLALAILGGASYFKSTSAARAFETAPVAAVWAPETLPPVFPPMPPAPTPQVAPTPPPAPPLDVAPAAPPSPVPPQP